jgi:azurin
MLLTHRISIGTWLGIAPLLLALGCGGGGSSPPASTEPAPAPAKPAEPTPPPPPPPPPAPVVAKPDASGVVHLQANDQMRFDATRIEAPAGKIKIELKNVGALPKEAMGHNLVILKPGTDPMAFAVATAGAKATEYVPPGAAEVLAHTKLLGPGESATVELELAAGTYPFVCTFPGHVGLMNGQLVVQ